MMESARNLEQTRLAILEHLSQQGHPARAAGTARAGEIQQSDDHGDSRPARTMMRRANGWFGRLSYAAGTWWRHHPAHMVLELSTPALESYARRKPFRYLGMAAGAGALLMLARPWKLISATGILVALFKSSQLSSVLISALSAADFRSDGQRQP